MYEFGSPEAGYYDDTISLVTAGDRLPTSTAFLDYDGAITGGTGEYLGLFNIMCVCCLSVDGEREREGALSLSLCLSIYLSIRLYLTDKPKGQTRHGIDLTIAVGKL